jgi:hypothetical protein
LLRLKQGAGPNETHVRRERLSSACVEETI